MPRRVVTIHVLDTPDVLAWADHFRQTYERRLLEGLKADERAALDRLLSRMEERERATRED